MEDGTREGQHLTEDHSQAVGPADGASAGQLGSPFPTPTPPECEWLSGHSPLQLLQGDCDPQTVAQHIESGQDVSPLHHLPQRPALQHPWAEHVPRFLCQEADVDKDLGEQDIGGQQQQQLLGLSTPPPGTPQKTIHSTQGLQTTFRHRTLGL